MNNYEKIDHPEILQHIFRPRQETRPPLANGCSDIDVAIETGVNLGCRLFLHEKTSPTILYFHGNGETVSDYAEIARLYNQSGLNILIATYRGYGWSSGVPSVGHMMLDCTVILQKSRQYFEEHNISGPLFVMGRSLGSAAAIELAARFPESFKGLIIESGFADTIPLLINLGLDPDEHSLQEIEGFGNRDKISTITMPTLILHGALDSIISIPQAERLQSFSGAKKKTFLVIPGADHNSTISIGGSHYFKTIEGFINEITGQSSWRNRRKKFKSTENNV